MQHIVIRQHHPHQSRNVAAAGHDIDRIRLRLVDTGVVLNIDLRLGVLLGIDGQNLLLVRLVRLMNIVLLGLVTGLQRQADGKGTAAAVTAFDLDAAIVHLDELPGYGQPDAGAQRRHRVRLVHLPETQENLVEVFRPDADTRIVHGNTDRPAIAAQSDAHFAARMRKGIGVL